MAKAPVKKAAWPWSPAGLLDALTENVSIQDLEMRIIYVNPATKSMYGEDIVGKLCYKVYDRRDDPCPDCPVQETFRTGRPASVVRVGRDGNGLPWFADITATPLKDSVGNAAAAIEVVRNVTERKLIEQAADRRYQETAALAEIATALNSRVEVDGILMVALQRSIEICRAEGGLIRLLNKRTGELETKAWHTKTGQDIFPDIMLPQEIGQGLVGGAAARSAEPQVIDDLEAVSDAAGSPHVEGLMALGIRSVVVVPLLSRGELLGTMSLGSFKKGNFSEANRGLLSAIAGQICVSIDNAELLEKTRKDAKVIAAYSKQLEGEVRVKVKELAASEEKFRTLVENASTAILAYDADGRITEVNQAAEDLLECSRQTLVGNFPEKIECCPQFTRVLPDVLAGVTLNGYEHEIKTGSGEVLSVVSNSAPILNESGEIMGVISTMVDITARQRLEAQLAREKTNIEQVLNNLPVGVHMYDHNQVFVDANTTFVRMTAGRDYRGRTLLEVFGPKIRPATRRIITNVRRCLKGEAIVEDFFNSLLDMWMHVSYIPIEREGRTQALIITEDVTEKLSLQKELKEYMGKLEKMVAKRTSQLSASEARYKRRNSELAAINGLVMLVNRSLNIKKMLRQALPKVISVIEAESGLVLIAGENGRWSTAAVKNLAPAEVERIIGKLKQIESLEGLSEWPGCSERGSLVVIPLTYNEEVLGFLGVCGRAGRGYSASDKSLMLSLGAGIGMALKNAGLYEEAEEKNRIITKAFVELNELDRLKSEFVSVVSHELRTPLAAIKGYIEVVKDGLAGSVTETQKDKLKKADARVDELTDLVADLLDLSAMESRKLKLKVRPVSVGAVVASALAGVEHLARTGELKISVVVKPTDLRIKCDGDKLVRVLSNLLENAIKFTPAGGRIEVAARDEGESVTFKVSDDGIGINREDLPKVFDRFFVGSEHAGGGTGLGLAIVKGIVEAHGGNVWARSRAGGGAAFLFSLPKNGKGGR